MSNEKFIVPSKLRGEDNHSITSVRLPNEILEKLDEISSRTERSRNQIIIMALEYALDRLEIEDGGTDA
ncbi:MAG: ribbon-helix-helix domain-containing protein [Oscillospiraceae bacterium]|nr:ribbon-helix-helix domain-containing protein [Oscillospiraceae bacterium]